MHAMRLVLSGLFDEHPPLKIILGHLGEAIPFLLSRIDEALTRDTLMKDFRKVFTRIFTSRPAASFRALPCDCASMRWARTTRFFSVAWPFASNANGVAWIKAAPLSDRERELVESGNAIRLLKLDW